jgi:hypothetical protein
MFSKYKLFCNYCGKECPNPDGEPFYVCADCTHVWLPESFRQLKALITDWLQWFRK